MNLLKRVRKVVAKAVLSTRITRTAFRRIALDEDVLLDILSDNLCEQRARQNHAITQKIRRMAAFLPSPPVPKKSQPATTLEVKQDPLTPLSIAINWGPRAFPLTRHAVYLRPGTRHLVERWLRRLSSDAFVVVLTEPSESSVAHALAARFGQIRHVLICALEGDAGALNGDVHARALLSPFQHLDAIAIPAALPHKAIEFMPNNTVPDFASVYPLFRRFWHLGFRQFALLSFGGFQQVEIPFLLDAFVDKHKGRRAFVVGNGPSLNKLDMKRLANEITLGSNRCYLGFPDWGFSFPYWACVDRLQLEEYGLEYQDALPRDTVKFFPFEYLPFFQWPNSCPINFTYDARPPYRFSGSPDIVYLGFTVTHTLLQIAVIMGCNPIYLIGVDHRYNLNEKTVQERRFGTKQAQVWVAEDTREPTHFTDKYTQGEQAKLFVTPKPEKAEACFAAAHTWAREHGIEIYNATPDSALEVFPKVDYDSLF